MIVGLVGKFYTPCLSRAVLYRRAVGYFTSHGLVCAAQGIAALLNNGGKIRLVASPLLNEADIEAINQGLQRPRRGDSASRPQRPFRMSKVVSPKVGWMRLRG